MKISRNNYLSIQGWMITDLKLSGNELLCYALIYNQPDNVFTDTSTYVCGWLNCTKKTALKTLKSLTDKGLLNKTVREVNNVRFCEYSIKTRRQNV